MIQRTNADMLFTDFYEQWITTYKQGAIRPVTMSKYKMAHQWLVRLIPDLKIGDITRITYQQLLNNYAAEHERQTTMDFHHHIKCAILDAVDEGLIERDPTRKAIIKGRPPKDKSRNISISLKSRSFSPIWIWGPTSAGTGLYCWWQKPVCVSPRPWL